MAVIEIISIDNATFEKKIGVISVVHSKVYEAHESSGGNIECEQVGTETSNLFNDIHFSKISVDGIVPTTVKQALTLINGVVSALSSSVGAADDSGQIFHHKFVHDPTLTQIQTLAFAPNTLKEIEFLVTQGSASVTVGGETIVYDSNGVVSGANFTEKVGIGEQIDIDITAGDIVMIIGKKI